jgi:predicted phage tail protein
MSIETKALSLMQIVQSRIFKLILMLLPFIAFATVSAAQSSITKTITSVICPIYVAVNTGIFILGLTLMILGGALYAAAHIMPAASKGSIQGYGMSMIIGGVIGVIIAELAPYILGLLTSTSSSAIKSYC